MGVGRCRAWAGAIEFRRARRGALAGRLRSYNPFDAQGRVAMNWFSRSRATTRAPGAAGGGALEPRVRAIGRELLEAARRHQRGALSTHFWSEKLMDWAMKDPGFKVQLFRFIDVFPALGSAEAVHGHLVDYLSRPGVTPPPGLSLGLKAGALAKGMTTKTISGRIEAMAQRFIAGEDAEAALPRLRELWDKGIGFSVDLLGEACVSEAEADAYRQRYLDLIERLPGRVADWPDAPRQARDHLGAIPRVNVSVKVSSLSPRTDPACFDDSLDRLTRSLRPILEAAARHGVFINFDMEQHQLKDLTIAVFKRCCEAVDFPAGIALQAYLRSGERDAADLIDWARAAGRRVSVRLIKGAYWDYETIHAEMMGWPRPVWARKAETDACFERMAARLIDATPGAAGEGGITLALGSHNARSLACGLALAERRDLPAEAVEVQMLHGMADELKAACVDRGLRVREYVPVGQMIPGMAYLVRRLLENTSNESWLRGGFAEGADDETLLAPPRVAESNDDDGVADAPQRDHGLAPGVEGVADGQPFTNEPPRDFADADQRGAFAAAVGRVRVPAVPIDATEADAAESVRIASEAFAAWRDRDARERAGLIVAAAERMRAQRDELAALVLREAAKPWRDADGDVCEAIDFCEYYARRAVGLFEPRRLGDFAGELNELWYQPRGVAAVISPWNFPLAICAGMTVAALVTGNTVVVKPAEQTPATAKRLCEVLWEAGVPREALHFLPGVGETVGAALVRDPRVALIAFTGSKAVGLDILAAAGHTPQEQPHVKRVVCEMGGKNAIVVDSSADLDEAVAGVRSSAFGYAGQKCSACSRVIVLDEVYETFVRRLVESTRALVIGDPADPATDVNPLIDDAAAEKVRRYIDLAREEGKLAFAGDVTDLGPRHVGPHIFTGVEPHHRLAREEVFGPVLAVMRAADFDEALKIANGSAYKLTGGVFSRTPKHLDRARRAFRVGNLYLNRGITGALVGRQPFGGFGLSGVGSKAGGPDYLLQFVEPRAVCENTMRRGFAPGVSD